MKKTLFIILFAVFSLASCLKDGGFTDTRPVYATFEYSGMDYAKLFGADSLYFESNGGYGLGWEYMAFLHKVDTSVADNWTFYGGVVLSYLKGQTFDPTDSLSMAQSDSLMYADNRFRANSEAEPLFGRTYLVYHQNSDPTLMPEHDVEFLATEVGTCQPLVCYVNNTNYVAYKVAQTFEDGDRLTLKATGYLKGVKTGEVSMELADFSAKKDSIVSTWTKFDLNNLASVDFVDFEVISTKEDFPADFCLDNFVTSVTISY